MNSERPVPASLLRRLAEAVAGLGRGEVKWLVASYAADDRLGHEVIGAFDSLHEAQEKVSSAEHGVFGPFTASETGPSETPRFEVATIAITLKSEDGVVQELAPLKGDEVDALFWSGSAIDKFVIPYYTAVSGLRVAEHVYRSFHDDPDVYLLRHLPGTKAEAGLWALKGRVGESTFVKVL